MSWLDQTSKILRDICNDKPILGNLSEILKRMITVARAALEEGWEVMKQFCQKECGSRGSWCAVGEDRLLQEFWSQTMLISESKEEMD